MESGYYAALAGLLARTQALDVTANNIANADTAGYKAQREFYTALTASSNAAGLSPLNRAINDFGVLGGTGLDLAQGTIERTGNPLDLAIQGKGFFTVQTARGIRYTRDGGFQLSPKGQLLSSEGDPVLDAKGKPIKLPSGPVDISADGAISSRGAIVAQIQLVDFPPGAKLTPEGNSYFTAPNAAAAPSKTATLQQGALERANISPIEGMIGLVEIQRNAELLQKALTSFDSDFNQIAVTELASVPS